MPLEMALLREPWSEFFIRGLYGRLYELGVLLVGVLSLRSLVLAVYVGAPVFVKRTYRGHIAFLTMAHLAYVLLKQRNGAQRTLEKVPNSSNTARCVCRCVSVSALRKQCAFVCWMFDNID